MSDTTQAAFPGPTSDTVSPAEGIPLGGRSDVEFGTTLSDPWPGHGGRAALLARHGRVAALNRTLAAVEASRVEHESAFIRVLHRHAESRVRVMSHVRDALDRPGGLAGAARVLVEWDEAGGPATSESGAASLSDLCAAARAFVVATIRSERLREANRLRLAGDLAGAPMA